MIGHTSEHLPGHWRTAPHLISSHRLDVEPSSVSFLLDLIFQLRNVPVFHQNTFFRRFHFRIQPILHALEPSEDSWPHCSTGWAWSTAASGCTNPVSIESVASVPVRPHCYFLNYFLSCTRLFVLHSESCTLRFSYRTDVIIGRGVGRGNPFTTFLFFMVTDASPALPSSVLVRRVFA